MPSRSRSFSQAPARLFALLLAAVLLVVSDRAVAQPAADAPAAAPKVPPGTWTGDLESLSKWLEQNRRGTKCTERCYVLDRLRLTGAVGEGPLKFELFGAVLADGPVAIPLFGPPAKVRLTGVTEDGKDALVGFEGDHYYLFTAAKRFVVKGSLTLEGDLALVIPGPLNALEADVAGGAVVEGARLSGLTGATIHLSRDGGAGAQSAGPTVFQLSRAVRVGREISFEYRLVMRSGTDLGVARIPLPFGEKVLDVTGSTGWRVEGGDLVLPTSGRTAEMTITGTLQKVERFAPDARSGYEWWLLESDPEHRISVKGDARQVDSAESPIPRTQTTSRLFLVQKGQHIELGVEPLRGVEVLAAVVRAHTRRIVLTERGDLVCDEQFTYENNGIDYLPYTPDGRPIYLSTDGKAERIMHQGPDTKAVLVPLRTGSHVVHTQALADATLGAFGGRLDLPVPSYPLTASHVQVMVGVPERVLPIALFGGDRPWWFIGGGDLFAVMLGFGAALIAVQPPPGASRRRGLGMQILGGAVLGALWLFSPGAFVAAIVIIATGLLVWLITRLFRGPAQVAVIVLLLGGALIVALAGSFAVRSSPSRTAGWADSGDLAPRSAAIAPAPSSGGEGKIANDRLGNAYKNPGEQTGVLEGVTPVALAIPGYARRVDVHRELVTRDRPLRPVLYYITDRASLPLFALWLAAAVVTLASQRGRFARLYERIRARLAAGPGGGAEPPKAPPPPPETPPDLV